MAMKTGAAYACAPVSHLMQKHRKKMEPRDYLSASARKTVIADAAFSLVHDPDVKDVLDITSFVNSHILKSIESLGFSGFVLSETIIYDMRKKTVSRAVDLMSYRRIFGLPLDARYRTYPQLTPKK